MKQPDLRREESLFALTLEVLTDRAAKLLLYHMVGVKEGKLQPPGDLAPNGGFAGAGEADEGDHTKVRA